MQRLWQHLQWRMIAADIRMMTMLHFSHTTFFDRFCKIILFSNCPVLLSQFGAATVHDLRINIEHLKCTNECQSAFVNLWKCNRLSRKEYKHKRN